jgi:ABC-type phosphate transport system substrate-binding protein
MNGLCKPCSDGLSRRLLILGATFACLGGSSAALADPLTIQGSTTFNRRIMEPYQTEIETISGQQLTVISNKSTPGLIALLEGRTHLAMISAPLETEVALLEKVMPGLSFEKLRERPTHRGTESALRQYSDASGPGRQPGAGSHRICSN